MSKAQELAQWFIDASTAPFPKIYRHPDLEDRCIVYAKQIQIPCTGNIYHRHAHIKADVAYMSTEVPTWDYIAYEKGLLIEPEREPVVEQEAVVETVPAETEAVVEIAPIVEQEAVVEESPVVEQEAVVEESPVVEEELPDFSAMTKSAIDNWARDRDINLDARMSKVKMIAALKEAL